MSSIQIKMVFEELDSKFANLLEMGRSGVVAALVAASQRLQINEQKVFAFMYNLFLQ